METEPSTPSPRAVWPDYLVQKYPRHETIWFSPSYELQRHTDRCPACLLGLDVFNFRTLDSQIMVGY